MWGSNSRIHGENYPQRGLKVGTIRMEVRALPLASDNYRLSIWLSDIHADYDYKPDILSFDFRPGAANDTTPERSNGTFGLAG